MRTGSLKIVGLVALAIVSLGCSQAQWQEEPGSLAHGPSTNGTQQQTPLTPQTPLPGHRPPQAFTDCSSQTLSVDVGTSKTDNNLKDFRTTIARYPQIRVTRIAKKKAKSTFFLNPLDPSMHVCADSACAEAAGWSQIQNDLMDLNEVNVACMGSPRPTPPRSSTDF